MSDQTLRALYQSVILEHNRAPRNRGSVDTETHRGRGFNPLCGDDISVSLRLKAERVEAIGFEGKGCAICTAAASRMTELATGQHTADLIVLADTFEKVVRGQDTSVTDELAAFAPVAGFPARIKCATLPWHALVHALNSDERIATTEAD